MLALLLAQLAAPQTAIDAERAFEKAAQERGQWTAFRAFSTPEAIMFWPQPVRAHETLPTENPPVSVKWQPAASFVSCDGKVAVNTGPWQRPTGVGYFTTVWEKQPDDSWKWVLDHGDVLAAPRPLPAKVEARKAACGEPRALPPLSTVTGTRVGRGASPDRTLQWHWIVWPDGRRKFQAMLWNGEIWQDVVVDEVAAPK